MDLMGLRYHSGRWPVMKWRIWCWLFTHSAVLLLWLAVSSIVDLLGWDWPCVWSTRLVLAYIWMSPWTYLLTAMLYSGLCQIVATTQPGTKPYGLRLWPGHFQ